MMTDISNLGYAEINNKSDILNSIFIDILDGSTLV